MDIWGICFQLFAGLIFLVKQLSDELSDDSRRHILNKLRGTVDHVRDWLSAIASGTKGRWRPILILTLISLPVWGILSLVFSDEEEIRLGVVGGALFWLLVASTAYLYLLRGVLGVLRRSKWNGHTVLADYHKDSSK